MLTYKGDFLEVNLSTKKLSVSKSVQKIESAINAMCLINQQPPAVVLAGQSGFVQTFDLEDH